MFEPWGILQNYVVIVVFQINACHLTILRVSLEVAFFNTAWSAGYCQFCRKYIGLFPYQRGFGASFISRGASSHPWLRATFRCLVSVDPVLMVFSATFIMFSGLVGYGVWLWQV